MADLEEKYKIANNVSKTRSSMEEYGKNNIPSQLFLEKF